MRPRLLTDEERLERRRESARARQEKRRRLLLEARAIAGALGPSDRNPGGRPKLSDGEKAECRRKYQRERYAKLKGSPVRPRLSDGERKAKAREKYARRMAKLGKTVTPRPKLTPEERLARRRERQRMYAKRKADAARRWRELKHEAAMLGLKEAQCGHGE